MNDWLQKVEEMKRQRAASSGVSAVPKSTASAGAKPNPFLNRAAGTSAAGTAASSSGVTSSAAGAKPNPFLNRAATSSSLQRTAGSPASPASGASSPAAVGSSSPSTSSFGDGIYKTRFEAEQRRRMELEALLKEKEREVAMLRQGRASGRTPEQIAAAKKKARMTRRQTARMSIHVGNTFDSVLSQIGGLDKKIRASEAAKLQAEDKLLEIAIAKLEVDDLVEKVDTVLAKIIEQIDKFSVPQLKGMLEKVRTQTRKEDASSAAEDDRVSCRFSIIMPKGGLQLADAPAPPPAPSGFIGAQGSAAPARAKPASLLEQIRGGHTLKNIDVAKLKEEQKQFRADAAKSMNDMKSLEETLKGAIMQRVLDMNPDGEDDEDEDLWDDDF